MTESLESLFIRALGIDTEMAACLVAEGFTSLEQVAYIPLEEFQEVECFRGVQVQDWRQRARDYLFRQDLAREGLEDDGWASPPEPEPEPFDPRPPKRGPTNHASATTDDETSHGKT